MKSTAPTGGVRSPIPQLRTTMSVLNKNNFVPVMTKNGTYIDVNYKSNSELGKRLSEGDSYVKAILNDVVIIFYPQEIF